MNDTAVTRAAAFFYNGGPMVPASNIFYLRAPVMWAWDWGGERKGGRTSYQRCDAVPRLFQGSFKSKNEMKVVPPPRR